MADFIAKNRLKVVGGSLLLLTIFGFVFFRGPMTHIQLPAESLHKPIAEFLVAGFRNTVALTNTILAAWLTIIVLFLISRAATRRMELVPRGWQNLMEAVLEYIRDLANQIAGPTYGRRFLPAVATIFFFVLVNNWMGLLPGYGSIGWVEEEAHGGVPFQLTQVGPVKLGFVMPGAAPAEAATEPLAGGKEAGDDEGVINGILVPWLRSANSDVNTPLALALMSMIFVEYWGISGLGLFRYGAKFFNFKQLLRFKIMGIVDAFIGLLELVSELSRLISFTFRLFGNIFAGEVLLAVIGFLMPWAVILPFYGLELIVGFMQAIVFAALTLVFGVMAVTAHDGGAHGEAAHGH